MKGLFDKCKIKNIESKNRFIRSATWEGLCDEEGHINDNFYNMYENIAKGGIGIIITGYATVFSYDKPSKCIAGIYDDSFIPEYKKLVDIIHKNNALVIAQMVLGKEYKNASYESYGFEDSMKNEYIEDIINKFSEAALRVKKAGFDGVQIHSAHGYFLSRVLSPIYNKRTDSYGENKEKLLVEIYKKIRETVGDDFIVGLKINSHDPEPLGGDFNQCLKTCIALDKLNIDFIEISGGDFKLSKNLKMESIYKEYAEKVANEVICKVALVALNRTPKNMEQILNSTKIEFMSLCRPIICEPNLINRWKSGDLNKAKCISCGKCYVDEHGNQCILNKK